MVIIDLFLSSSWSYFSPLVPLISPFFRLPVELTWNVQCTAYSVCCTVYRLQCIVYSVQFHCTVYSVQCTAYSALYSIVNIHPTPV